MNRHVRTAAAILFVAALYFAGGKVGLVLWSVNPSSTAVWPPTGIALAAVLLLGPRVAPGIFIAAFLVNLNTPKGTVITSVGIAVGNTLEALAGAWAVKRFAHGSNAFDRARDVYRYMLVAAVLATMISATIGVSVLCAGKLEHWSNFYHVWIVWWLGDCVSAIVIAPLLLIWATRQPPHLTVERIVEAACLLTSLCVIFVGVFGGWSEAVGNEYPLEYAGIPVLLWAALRFQQRGAVTAAAIMSAIAIRGTRALHGPFATSANGEPFILLQAFLGTISVTALVVAAVTSERIEAEESVRRSEARLRLGLDAGSTGTWDWDIVNNHVTWSDRVYEMHGVRPGEFGGAVEDFTKLVHPEDSSRVRQTIERSIDQRIPYEIEFRVVHANGEAHWLATRGRVYYDRAGRPLRMLGVTRDVTESRKAEEERARLLESERTARSEAERANQMKDEFLAILSHELRTPLNAILGWTQILRHGSNDREEMQEGLEIIERNARDQAQMIEDLLDTSRVTSGKLRLNLKPLDLVTVIADAIETVRPAAEARHIMVSSEFERTSQTAMGDADRVKQVLWNLLSNAIRFTPVGGLVRVCLSEVGANVEISVVDTGDGIRPEFLPHIFDRFRQADASITRRHGGLGLGLAIVKQLVELHGGNVRAQSDGEGQGATFTVTLPAANLADSRPSLRPDSESDDPSTTGFNVDLGGRRVLAVDDEPDARALIQRLLEDRNAKVVVAASVAEALVLFHQHQPDLLISDIGMPDEDGYSLIRKVRTLPNDQGGNVPAVAVTAYARPEDGQRALLAGFQKHMAKPIEPVELLRVVAMLAKERDVV